MGQRTPDEPAIHAVPRGGQWSLTDHHEAPSGRPPKEVQVTFDPKFILHTCTHTEMPDPGHAPQPRLWPQKGKTCHK